MAGTVAGQHGNLLHRLDALLDAGQGSEPVPAWDQPEAIDLEAALRSPDWLSLEALSEARLYRLRRKIEVAGKLFCRYTADLSRPVTDSPLPDKSVVQLCLLLLKAALVENDPRHLNAALKLMDGVAIPPAVIIPEEVRAVARLVMETLVPLR